MGIPPYWEDLQFSLSTITADFLFLSVTTFSFHLNFVERGSPSPTFSTNRGYRCRLSSLFHPDTCLHFYRAQGSAFVPTARGLASGFINARSRAFGPSIFCKNNYFAEFELTTSTFSRLRDLIIIEAPWTLAVTVKAHGLIAYALTVRFRSQSAAILGCRYFFMFNCSKW